MPPTPQGGAGGGLRRLSKLFSSCSSGFGGSDHAMAEAGLAAGPQPASPSAASASGSAAPAVRLNIEELGEPDCLLVGAGWTIPVHRWVRGMRGGRGLWAGGAAGCRACLQSVHRVCQRIRRQRRLVHTASAAQHCHPLPLRRSVLRQRCDHFRARCDRGWADSSADRVAVPDHFSREAVDAFLHYCYTGGWVAGCGGWGGAGFGDGFGGRCWVWWAS